jgi:pimeloyl-ACP methyl ester carboxylesterase
MTTTLPSANSQLYWEIKGTGPAVLLIAGTPGDSGQFDRVAAELASHRTVITYDRRGTSRSPSIPDWNSTSVAEQAGDAAAVLTASGGGPALVYGTSNGAAIALELALRRPDLVRGAILHELPLLSVIADPAPIGAMIGSVIETGMAAGGPPQALDGFLRFAFGDTVVDGWSHELRNRMLANADMAFGVELPAFQAYHPDEDALRAAQVPVHVVVGADQLAPFFGEAAAWLADRLGPTVRTWPGAHGPQFTCPAELAGAITAVDPA